ncbi:MAG: oligosaccharide repeat unit polymerase [Clostridia bacterium]|nr:oligosaccharide repeat unit polymerase [Clostridia bacterium]
MAKFLKSFNDKYFDICSILILTVCCFISLFLQWFSLSIIAFAIFYFFFTDYEKSLGAVVFLIPFHNVLRLANTTIIVYSTFVSFFVIAFIKLLINKEIRFNKVISIILSCLLVYSLLPIGTYKMIRWRWLSTFFIIIGSCFILKHLLNKIEFSKIAYYLFLGIIISSLFRITLESNTFIEKFELNSFENRFEALMINPNYLSETCAMISSILLVVLYKNKNIIFTSICFVLTSFIGLKTGSKSFAILSIIFITVFLFYYFLKAKEKHKPLFQILILSLFILGIVLSVNFLKYRLDFNHEVSTTELLTNRNTIWKMAFKELGKNPLTLLFGLGVGSEIRWENAQTCHSVYIEILQKFGIVGSLIFVGLTIYCIIILFKKYGIKKNLINFLPLFILAIYSLTDTIIFPATSMMIFPICFIFLLYKLPKRDEG